MRMRGRKREAAALAIGVVALGGVIAAPTVASASSPARQSIAGTAHLATAAKAADGHAISCVAVKGTKGAKARPALPKMGAVPKAGTTKITRSGPATRTFSSGKLPKGAKTIRIRAGEKGLQTVKAGKARAGTKASGTLPAGVSYTTIRMK